MNRRYESAMNLGRFYSANCLEEDFSEVRSVLPKRSKSSRPHRLDSSPIHPHMLFWAAD
jgi:hypothetical protein